MKVFTKEFYALLLFIAILTTAVTATISATYISTIMVWQVKVVD